MGTAPSKRRTPAANSDTLRAVAHPVRLRLYELLVVGGPATAAKLARDVPGAPGSLSYHLHQLAAHGFIEEVPELAADGRERWWRAVPGGIHWSDEDLDHNPGTQEAATAAQTVLFSRQFDRIRNWVREGHKRWDARWRAASINSDTMLHLTPSELRALGQELDDVLEPWRERSRLTRDSRCVPLEGGHAEQRESVFLSIHAFPFRASSSDQGSVTSSITDAENDAAPDTTRP